MLMKVSCTLSFFEKNSRAAEERSLGAEHKSEGAEH
jgi:hypothetical protein